MFERRERREDAHRVPDVVQGQNVESRVVIDPRDRQWRCNYAVCAVAAELTADVGVLREDSQLWMLPGESECYGSSHIMLRHACSPLGKNLCLLL